MIDFPILFEGSLPHWIWTVCGFAYYFILLFYYRRVVSNKLWEETKPYTKHFLFFCIAVFAICAFYTGDFSHYQEIVKTERDINHMEDVYQAVISFVNNNYLLFRIIFWGGGTLLLMVAFKNCSLDPYRSLFYLFASYITSFSYSRAGVALAVYFCGVSFMFDNGKRGLLLRLLGLGLVVSSYFFHNSLLVPVILTPVAFIPINKKTLFVYLFAVLALFVFSDSLLGNIMREAMTIEDISERIDAYKLKIGFRAHSGLIPTITFFWLKLIVHLPFWVAVVMVFKHQSSYHIPGNIMAMFRISVLLYVFFMLMFSVYGEVSPFYYRYEGMIYIPITIMINYLYQEHILSRKTFERLILFGALWLCWDFFYRIFFT